MKKLLLATALLFATTAISSAAVIENLGVNPTSSTGSFDNSVGGGAFSDQYTFQLVGGAQFITIASVTNVFPSTTDFITNFTGSVLTTGANGVIGGGDDVTVIGPIAATACPITPNCQGFSGAALLNAGSYYLNISGIGGGTSGYGGNLATAAVAIPGPLAGAGIPGVIAGGLMLLGLVRRRQRRDAA